MDSDLNEFNPFEYFGGDNIVDETSNALTCEGVSVSMGKKRKQKSIV